MSQKSRKLVKIFDVTLRDGIQNLKRNHIPIFSPSVKLNIINRLISANIKQIEFGSNVSHKIIEMSNTKDVVGLFNVHNQTNETNLCLLVPNYIKYTDTFNWPGSNFINKYSLITACSESFINKNTQMTLKQNIEDIDKILENSRKNFRLYVSCCFGCPIEGVTNLKHLNNLHLIINKYASNPVIDEIVLSDTIGSYDMAQLDDYMKLYKSSHKISLHIHSQEHDKNIQKIIHSYFTDIISIDTSMGNIGGCPSVEKSKVKPNLSTLKVAEIINEIERKPIYNVKEIASLETLVQNIINSHINNPPHI
jgi:isopropylmalate/homocitrate/citramalate synthase